MLKLLFIADFGILANLSTDIVETLQKNLKEQFLIILLSFLSVERSENQETHCFSLLCRRNNRDIKKTSFVSVISYG